MAAVTCATETPLCTPDDVKSGKLPAGTVGGAVGSCG
jgi:hypothetical protein